MWVYIESEEGVFTVGFYAPDGKWMAETDCDSKDEAASRVHFLNGGSREFIYTT